MYKKSIILLLVVAICITTILPSLTVLGEEDLIKDESSTFQIEEKLDSISKEEKEILEILFSQIQEIEELERENNRLNLEIIDIEMDIKDLEKRIFSAEEGYEKNLMALERLFKSYQRMGAGSYLEIILESKSVQDFLRRMNLLKDLSRNSKELLDNIEKDKKNLEEEKEKLDFKLNELVEIQNTLEETLVKKQALVKENEDYLESLAGDRALYEERLGYLSLIMDELKTILREFTVEFAKVIESGNFPRDAVKETITLKGIKGTIEEKTFNHIIKNQKNLPYIEIKFKEDIIEMNVPEKQLYLSGSFIVENDSVLAFQPEEGTFFGMHLEKGTIEELFKEGNFLLDLEPLIGKAIVKSVTIKNGYLEMIVSVKLF